MRLVSRRPVGLILVAVGGLLIGLANRFPLPPRKYAVVLGLVAVAVGLILLNDSIGVDPADDEPLA